MPTIRPSHMVFVTLNDYLPQQFMSDEKGVDTLQALCEILASAGIPCSGAGGDFGDHTLKLFFESEYEAIKAEDLISDHLDRLGAALRAGEAAMKAVLNTPLGGDGGSSTASSGDHGGDNASRSSQGELPFLN